MFFLLSPFTIFALGMKLDVLICTLNEGICRVPEVLIAPREDVMYVVSMQYTDECFLQHIPHSLRERKDVQLITLPGRGLCRNRNHALLAARADIALIADDDVRYCDEYFDRIIETFERNKEVDVAHFKIQSTDGGVVKDYPEEHYRYPHVPRGMYVSSIEIALRIHTVRNRVQFDERFGLGSPYFICGEEDIFIRDAAQAGLHIAYFPLVIVQHPDDSTGSRTYTDERVMMAKGAVQYYLHGNSAWLRMFKFALISAVHRKGSFTQLLRATFKGINYYRKVVKYENPTGR